MKNLSKERCCNSLKEHAKCPHLTDQVKGEALRALNAIGRYMATLRENRAKGVACQGPHCATCGNFQRLHVSLHSPAVFCWNHLPSYCEANHSFLSVELSSMEVYCYLCKDYVYLNDDDIALKWKGYGLNGRWAPTDKERALLSEHAKSVFLKEHMLGLRGINNLGNTCFMSVIIQVFVNNPLFWTYFLEDSHSPSNCQQSKSGQNCITCNMETTFTEMFASDKTPYSPLHLMYSIWKDQESHMAGYHQQDAHEFFAVLLQGFHTGWKTRFNLRASGPDPCQCTVHKLFGGNLRSDLLCEDCDTMSTVSEPFLHISLGLPEINYSRNSGTSIMDCLSEYCNLELLPDAPPCKRCNNQMKKQMSVNTLPSILCLHLKRFKQERNDERKKVGTCVSYPEELNLSPYLSGPIIKKRNGEVDNSSPVIYRLYAVVNHIGHSMDNGHYTCYIHHYLTSHWFKFDDHMVSRATVSEVLGNQSHAYMLFYMRDV
eukprot:TRINITY_DN3316_c0_g1_i3.p1 TRINITY_DN3316_c0_g1~~TRINITY_DN3316_c0_g1_i3.p1  ORF type:complete len:487 (-),score=45.60 TRINITY_DN3316_c0_g1_i3:17-1477(-)